MAVDDFFALGYVPDPATIFTAIRKLPAAHYMLLPPRGDPPTRGRCATGGPLCAPAGMDEAEAADSLRRQLRAATAARLMADVPLGAFLSGGVDSAAVVANAAMLRAEAGWPGLDTFTIGFAGAEDETPFAAEVGAALRHDAAQRDRRRDRLDRRRARAGAAVRRAVRRHILGADRGGLPRWRVGTRRWRCRAMAATRCSRAIAAIAGIVWSMACAPHVPAGAAPLRAGRLARVYPKLDRAPRWLRAKHTLTELSLDSALGYYRTVARVQHDRRRALFSPALEAALDGHDPQARIAALMDESGSDDALVQAQYADLNTWLVGDILTKVDRASMANSLEVRAPLLDHRLVEWGLSLPPDLKLRGASGKHLLKRAMEPLLPRDMLYRPKQGFATSLAAPLRAGADACCASGCWGRRCWTAACSSRGRSPS